jgi:hypothetical protein
MAAQPKDPKNPSNKPAKKKTETVLLSADELRALTGGSSPTGGGSSTGGGGGGLQVTPGAKKIIP